jgi:cytochrome P450
MERCRARYGKRYTIRFPGSPPFVMLADPDDVKEVFTAPPDVLHPGEGARVLEPVVGANSVILLDGDAHMRQRKLMLPAFHGENMERLEGLMAEVAEREVASWPHGEEAELQERFQHLTMEIILRAVFGLDPGERLDVLRGRLSRMLRFGDRPISLVPIDPDGIVGKLVAMSPPFARFLRLQAEADALIFELIEERRRGDEKRDDVLTMLLAARDEEGAPMSDQELRDELMTLLVAGHETTASSLSWSFERLLRLPNVRNRLVEEIDAGEEDAYLTATIQETLRRRPVLPNAAPRLVKQPIEVGRREYGPGVCLVAATYLIHHDPEIYPDPYAFRPERFLDEPPGTYTWTPFGGGRRRCLGASFAMTEMKAVLRSVLGGCEPAPAEPADESPRRRNITVRPGRGSRALVRRRGDGRTRSKAAVPAVSSDAYAVRDGGGPSPGRRGAERDVADGGTEDEGRLLRGGPAQAARLAGKPTLPSPSKRAADGN